MSQMVEHVIRSQDGLGLFVRDYAPEAPVTGLPVLCLHGLTRNSRDFEEVAPRIAALGRRVICPDVRGRGRSDWDSKPDSYAPPVYVADTLRILSQLNVERCVWLGTSMGGIMTMIAAATAPHLVAAVALNDVGPALDPKGIARIMGYVGRRQPVADLATAAAAIRAVNGVAFPKAQDDAFWLTFAERTFRRQADGRFELDYDPAIAQAFATPPSTAAPVDMWPLFEALKPIPAIVFRGALSDLLAPETVTEMQRRKPDLEAVEVADVGHAPTLEEEDAWGALMTFLARAP